MHEGPGGKYAVDECNFTINNGEEAWVIGCIETTTKKFRIDILHGRNSNNIEKFIKEYIPLNSTVITDGS